MTRYLFSIVLVTVTMFLLKHSNKLHANAFRMTRSGANTAIMARRGAFSGNHLNMADETVRTEDVWKSKKLRTVDNVRI